MGNTPSELTTNFKPTAPESPEVMIPKVVICGNVNHLWQTWWEIRGIDISKLTTDEFYKLHNKYAYKNCCD